MAGSAWTKDQVRSLIKCYREEPCLYAIKHRNYHNKNLRNAALERVSSVVRQLRPNVTAKEWQAKIHTLRIQFNVENIKRKRSLNKSGNRAADVYTPSLWYFDSMRFFEEHYAPRKSESSRIGTATEEDVTGSHSAASFASMNSQGFDEMGVLHVNIDDNDTQFTELSERRSLDSPSASSSSSCSYMLMTPLPPPTTAISPDNSSRPQSAPSQSHQTLPNTVTTLSVSTFLPPTNRPNKRKRSDESAFVGAIEAIAETSKQPPPELRKPAELNPVDACMNFLGSMLKTYKSQSRQIEVMNKLVQTVLLAKAEEEV